MRIDLMFVINDRYAPILATALASIRENCGNDDEIWAHVLQSGLTLRHESMLKAMETSRFALRFYDVGTEIETLETAVSIPGNGNMITCARLLCARYLPKNVDRVLFLDCDILVQGSFSELFTMDMYGCVVGASLDVVPYIYREAIRLRCPKEYYNTGVLLIDMKRWRSENVEEGLFALVKEAPLRYFWLDQDVLNLYFSGHVACLPIQYCVFYPIYQWPYRHVRALMREQSAFYSEEEFDKGVNAPVLIHLVGTVESHPWKKGNWCGMTDEWMRYLRLSGFEGEFEPFENKQSRTSRFFNKNLYHWLPHGLWFPVFLTRWNKHMREKIDAL